MSRKEVTVKREMFPSSSLYFLNYITKYYHTLFIIPKISYKYAIFEVSYLGELPVLLFLRSLSIEEFERQHILTRTKSINIV